ncbi:MAG: ferrous iron transport protein A, partial [Bacteroidota bacterium]
IMEATADLLKEGEKAKIAGLTEGQFSLKLAEMGCVPGTEIIRLYESSGGSTIAYRIDTYLLGLRKEEARLIQVEPIETVIA